jgi:SAM-dependent methyltransferase
LDHLFFLRSTFNTVAQDYDAIRPGYPEELVNDIFSFASLPSTSRCLEIGCGTGQATLPFARRGCEILCLDIGEQLLARAAEKLRPFPAVRFQKVAFENWPPESELFDLFFSATAFHWVPPEIGYPKAAQVLRSGGTLALFWNVHPLEKEGFFAEVDEVYQRYYPGWVALEKRPSKISPDPSITQLIDGTGLFGAVDARVYPSPQGYSTAQYIQLINTFSDHLAMPEKARFELYSGIADLIERRYAGKVIKNAQTELFLARRSAGER